MTPREGSIICQSSSLSMFLELVPHLYEPLLANQVLGGTTGFLEKSKLQASSGGLFPPCTVETFRAVSKRMPWI